MRPALITRTAAGGAVLALGLALSACSSSPTTPASSDGSLAVVATTTQVADFTRQVMTDDVELTTLLEPNQSAHHFDPTAADLTTLARADVLVVSGAGLETWLRDAVDASGFRGTVVDASSRLTLSGEAEDDDEHADGDGDPGPSSDPSGASTDGTSAGTDVDAALASAERADGNPHVWTDPNNASVMTQTIADGLAAAAPQDAAALQSNAAAYEARLAELDGWVRANVDQVPADERLVVSNHDAFHYFTDRYGITFVGSIIPSFEDNAEPSASQIQALVDTIRSMHVRAIFSETSISPKTASSIASAAGVKVYSGDDALYGDSLGAPGSDGATYVAATVHNTRVLVESWGATPTPLPGDLES